MFNIKAFLTYRFLNFHCIISKVLEKNIYDNCCLKSCFQTVTFHTTPTATILKQYLCHLAWVDQKRRHALLSYKVRASNRKLLPKKQAIRYVYVPSWHDIILSFGSNLQTDVYILYLDFKKAFDSVAHNELLVKTIMVFCV